MRRRCDRSKIGETGWWWGKGSACLVCREGAGGRSPSYQRKWQLDQCTVDQCSATSALPLTAATTPHPRHAQQIRSSSSGCHSFALGFKGHCSATSASADVRQAPTPCHITSWWAQKPGQLHELAGFMEGGAGDVGCDLRHLRLTDCEIKTSALHLFCIHPCLLSGFAHLSPKQGHKFALI